MSTSSISSSSAVSAVPIQAAVVDTNLLGRLRYVPEDLMPAISSYLSDRDKLSMLAVCRTWNQAPALQHIGEQCKMRRFLRGGSLGLYKYREYMPPTFPTRRLGGTTLNIQLDPFSISVNGISLNNKVDPNRAVSPHEYGGRRFRTCFLLAEDRFVLVFHDAISIWRKLKGDWEEISNTSEMFRVKSFGIWDALKVSHSLIIHFYAGNPEEEFLASVDLHQQPLQISSKLSLSRIKKRSEPEVVFEHDPVVFNQDAVFIFKRMKGDLEKPAVLNSTPMSLRRENGSAPHPSPAVNDSTQPEKQGCPTGWHISVEKYTVRPNKQGVIEELSLVWELKSPIIPSKQTKAHGLGPELACPSVMLDRLDAIDNRCGCVSPTMFNVPKGYEIEYSPPTLEKSFGNFQWIVYLSTQGYNCFKPGLRYTEPGHESVFCWTVVDAITGQLVDRFLLHPRNPGKIRWACSFALQGDFFVFYNQHSTLYARDLRSGRLYCGDQLDRGDTFDYFRLVPNVSRLGLDIIMEKISRSSWTRLSIYPFAGKNIVGSHAANMGITAPTSTASSGAASASSSSSTASSSPTKTGEVAAQATKEDKKSAK